MKIYLHPGQVRQLIKKAEKEDEVIVIRCIRKGPATKPGGPDKGDLQDLHCTKKPPYVPVGVRNRKAEDRKSGVLTVFVTNRRNKKGQLGDWRRVNIQKVQKVIYKTQEYEVVAS